MEQASTLYIVIPCYNEQAVLMETVTRLSEKMQRLFRRKMVSEGSRIVLVDDGSDDSTWTMIQNLFDTNPWIQGIKSSRNRGHQYALLEGLMTVKDHCDITISMDADLQDDIEVLDQFIEKYQAGSEIVYGVRKTRDKDTLFKRSTAQSFYKLLAFMGVEVVYNHADYRLLSKRALDELEKYQEVNLYLRGIIPLLGFKTDTVEYDRKERYAGTTKYPLGKMLGFAIEGITSLSIAPIRLITRIGFLVFAVSIVLMIHYIIGYYSGNTVPGWATIVVSLWGIGGLQLLAIGVIGEYIGKIYLESKKRPRYIVEEYLKK